jgi:signal peptidase I
MHEESSDNFFTELLKFVALAALIVFPIRLFVAQPFIVSGASMQPTFQHGEYIIVDELSYRMSAPQRGDVIIFRYPRNPKEFFIKRIIGLPGEQVALSGNVITITKTDGTKESILEPYISNHGNGSNTTYSLKTEEYFVMGDNRPESSDSRTWGPLPRGNIIGRAFIRLLPLQHISLMPGSTSYSTPTTVAPVQ